MSHLNRHVVELVVCRTGHVELDGDRFPSDELFDPAKLVEHGGKHLGDLPIVFWTDSDGHAA
jgi:hypothetical protein